MQKFLNSILRRTEFCPCAFFLLRFKFKKLFKNFFDYFFFLQECKKFDCSEKINKEEFSLHFRVRFAQSKFFFKISIEFLFFLSRIFFRNDEILNRFEKMKYWEKNGKILSQKQAEIDLMENWENENLAENLPEIPSDSLTKFSSGLSSKIPSDSSFASLTHLDASGKAQMVDVGEKSPTKRTARAEATV